MDRIIERIFLFFPSVFTLVCIAIITRVYLRLIFKHYEENLKGVEWQQKNKRRVAWMIDKPTNFIWAPIYEELMFRAPLIIVFDTISYLAWCGIVVSACLFSVKHWQIKKSWLQVVLAFIFSVLAGYFGVKYQSIWLSVGIHFAWNLIMPIVIPTLQIGGDIVRRSIFSMKQGKLL
jgi:membrane protease YdiL (CAAX protease family)